MDQLLCLVTVELDRPIERVILPGFSLHLSIRRIERGIGTHFCKAVLDVAIPVRTKLAKEHPPSKTLLPSKNLKQERPFMARHPFHHVWRWGIITRILSIVWNHVWRKSIQCGIGSTISPRPLR